MATIPSTLAPQITDFTPAKQYPSFSGIINQKFVPALVPTGSAAITAAQINGGLIIHTANGASTDTFPSAQSLAQNTPGVEIGTGIMVYLYNNGTSTVTVAAGTGGTLKAASGAVATLSIREFLLIFTAIGDVNNTGATYDLYSLGVATAE
jgi:hypothetical protein